MYFILKMSSNNFHKVCSFPSSSLSLEVNLKGEYFIKSKKKVLSSLPIKKFTCRLFVYKNFLYIENLSLNDPDFNKVKSILFNLVKGSVIRYVERISIHGVGYRFIDKNLGTFSVKAGYSHLINLVIPKGITVLFLSNTELCLYSSNYDSLKLFLLKIKMVRFPDPYKSKGIRYFNEILITKSGSTKKSL